jgi:hypothetical protein
MTTQDFLVKDYELKIRYLSDHFSRMWNRFNYFVAIESALISGKFVLGNGKMTQGVAIVGAVLALVWYIMGAEDRYLVLVYRKQVEDAGKLIERSIWEDNNTSYHYVGEIENTSKALPASVSGWRLKAMSTTKLAALIPLLLTLTWIGVLIRELR